MSLLKFKVVTEPHHCGRVFKARALRETLDIVDLIIKTEDPERFSSRLRRGVHYFIRYPKNKLPTAKSIIVKDDISIFTTYAFHIPKEVEAAYYEAKLMTMPEAEASERSTRLSLRGVIKKLSPIEFLNSCPRRELDLEEAETSSTIKCTILGRACTAHLPEGSHATLTNLETTVFKGAVKVCTTPETVISVTDGEQTLTSQVSAYAYNANNTTELLFEQETSYRTYTASNDLIMELICSEDLDDLQLLLPFRCTITYCPVTATIRTIRCKQS